MAGANPQAARHCTTSSVNLPSGVISPGLIFSRRADELDDRLRAANQVTGQTLADLDKVLPCGLELEHGVKAGRCVNLPGSRLSRSGNALDGFGTEPAILFLSQIQRRQQHCPGSSDRRTLDFECLEA